MGSAAASARWRAAHRQQHQAASARWRAEHKARAQETTRQWRDKNKDRYVESQRQWAAANKDRINRTASARRALNRSEFNRKRRLRRQANKDLVHIRERRRNLRYLYGLTEQEYAVMLGKQGGGCAICGTRDTGNGREKHLPVDHDHTTRAVRGIVCSHCNRGLGYFKDNPERLLAAAVYLERHRRETVKVCNQSTH